MNLAKLLYHRLIPAFVRNPFGLWRRELLRRLTRAPQIPPAPLLQRIQSTATASEYLEVGQRAAESVSRIIVLSIPGTPRLLDLGCGPGRVLRHLPELWEMTGVDEFGDAVEWSRRNISRARFVEADPGGPLPFEDNAFSVLIAVSLLPNLEPSRRENVTVEAARLLEDGGLFIVSTPGLAVLSAFDPTASPTELRRAGILRARSGPFLFTAGGLDALFSEHFDPVLWEEQGLDGFQDLSVYRRRPRAPASG